MNRFFVPTLLSSVATSLLVGLLVLTALTGCNRALEKPDVLPWSDAFIEAGRLSGDERRDALRKLIETAPSEERRRRAQFDLASFELRHGDKDVGREIFKSIIAADGSDRIASRSRYELGRMAFEVDQDPRAGEEMLVATILETAPWAGADLALEYLLRHHSRAQTLPLFAQELESLAGEQKENRLAARLYLERGKIIGAIPGRANDALQAYRLAFQRCPDCAASEDALMEMAEIYQRFGQPAAAIQALTIVANRTQRSFFVGTYSSHRASEARFTLGSIAMDQLEDYEKARDHFERFLRDFEGHIRTDHVAWRLVLLERETGSPRAYRRALERFVSEYPYSRFLSEARTRLEEVS